MIRAAQRFFSLPVQSNSAVAEFDMFSAEIGQARFRMEGGVGSSPRFGLVERAATLPSPASGGGVRKAFRIRPILTAAFVGSPSSQAQVETNDPGVVSGTLARIKMTGTVRLGYRDASIPFSYLARSRRPIGYSIDICNAIVEEIGRTLDREDLKVDFVKVTSETRLQAIVEGAIDLECGSTTNNLERRKLGGFSPMTFVSGTKVM